MKYPLKVKEERTIKRITLKHTFYDFLDSFNIERGLIYTLKLLFANPGKAINLYLNEGRYKLFNVFRLLVISTAVSLFVMYLAGIDELVLAFEEEFSRGFNDSAKESGQQLEELKGFIPQIFLDWYNLLLWIAIPQYAFLSYLFYQKSNLNYAEHLVIQTFHVSTINVITLVFFPFHLVFGTSAIVFLIMVGCTSYFVFFATQIFGKKGLWSYAKASLLYILSNVIYTLFMTIALGMIVGYKLGMFQVLNNISVSHFMDRR